MPINTIVKRIWSLTVILWIGGVCICCACNSDFKNLTDDQRRDFTEAAPYARIAADVYDGSGSGGYTRLDQYDSKTLLPDSPQSGFHAATYTNDKGELVIAYEGTDFTSLVDWGTDIAGGLNLLTTQHALAVEYALSIMQKNPGKKIILTGHSLGGGLAQYAAIGLGLEAKTFNSAAVPAGNLLKLYAQSLDALVNAGVLDEGRKTALLNDFIDPKSKIKNYVQENDIVNPVSQVFGGGNFGETIGIKYDWDTSLKSKIIEGIPFFGDIWRECQEHSSKNAADYFECIKHDFESNKNSPKNDNNCTSVSGGAATKDQTKKDASSGTMLPVCKSSDAKSSKNKKTQDYTPSPYTPQPEYQKSTYTPQPEYQKPPPIQSPW
jgi:hypothetical protein